jgi:cytochrome c-type biogenesis protein CcmH/NrfG
MTPTSPSNSWTPRVAIVLSAVCFIIGIAFGFVAHGPATQKIKAASAAVNTPVPVAPDMAPPISTETPSPQQLKAASRQAAIPVLDQLKKDPKNFKLLLQAGEMYYHHGAYSEAAGFYERALAVKDNPLVRNQLASALYYQGNADGALKQYALVLATLPTNDIALFNTGMIRLKAKHDNKGAIQSWEKLLKAYPNHPQKDRVQSLIDKAAQQQS